MASGSVWNLWMWLTGDGCGWNLWACLVGVFLKRYIDFHIYITYSYSSCICSFLQQHAYFLFIFNYKN